MMGLSTVYNAVNAKINRGTEIMFEFNPVILLYLDISPMVQSYH